MGIHASRTVSAVAVLALGACAAGPVPQSSVERVDERTAVTVVTLPKPLLFSGARGPRGESLDLALGPVEINRMGEKTWYVWASLLGGDLQDGDPRLRLVSGGTTIVDLAPAPAGFSPPVSERPYRRLADWATERWYEISAGELARLYGLPDVTAEIDGSAGSWRFDPWEASVATLDAYLRDQLQGRVASR